MTAVTVGKAAEDGSNSSRWLPLFTGGRESTAGRKTSGSVLARERKKKCSRLAPQLIVVAGKYGRDEGCRDFDEPRK